MSQRLIRRFAPCLALSLMIAACGGSPATVTDGSAARYTAAGMVLENRYHGPQLCMTVMTSDPPQCEGIDIAGWDWNAVASESGGDIRWGTYRLTGTWSGKHLTLTETPQRPTASPAPADESEKKFASPCPEPTGGWKPVDPARATDEAMGKAMSQASTTAEFAGAWIDQAYLKRVGPSPQASEAANDPTRYVLNLRFTGDLAGRERWIREVWGGALCVSGAERSEAELRDIQRRLDKEVEGLQSSGVSILDNHVEAHIPVVTDELQRELDNRYGVGVVVLRGILQPVK